MNWFKFSQFAPISIVSYNNYGELGIVFDGGKKYIYNNVHKELYSKIRDLLYKKNYKKVGKILQRLK